MGELADIEDLEDRLIVLENLVEELKAPKISKPELEILLSQYVALEDSILAGIEKLSAEIPEDQKEMLDACAEKYNHLGCDFQDTWTDEYWNMYELVRGGYENSFKSKSPASKKVSEVQELALTLNRASGKFSTLNLGEKKALKEIDCMAEQYQESTVEPEPVQIPVKKKCCSGCEVY